jgi:glucose-1-phosphate thymidylyltransferase
MSTSQDRTQEIIGLIPAGGQATRLSPLPCSKELYPIGFRSVSGEGDESGDRGIQTMRSKVVSHYLLENMRLAGIQKAYLILRPGKWDIPAYFGDGSLLDMHLGYLLTGLPYGVPYTLDQAYPFVQNALIALGYPDILFQPEDAFKQLLTRQAETQAEVVLGVVPFDHPHKGGMVDMDAQGRVHQVLEKPAQSDLRHSWYIAVWTPVFTTFMHQHLIAIQAADRASRSQSRELPLGDVIHAAVEHGLQVEAHLFSDGSFLDIGTPEDLIRATRMFV